MNPWRLNLNSDIVDARDAYDTSKFDNYYNMSLLPSTLTTSVSADALNKVEAEINKPNLLWDKNQVKKLGYYNFNTAFNNTGFNQFFGYNKDKSDIFGPSTYNRYAFYNSLKQNYNSPEKTMNGVYWNGTTWIKKPQTLQDNYLAQNEISLDFKPVTGLNDNKTGGNKSFLNEEDNPTGESSRITEIDTILNKVFKKPEETLFSKILKNLPLATNTANLMSSLISNRKNEKILKEGLFPVLQNTYERFSPVTGAFGLTQQANKQAANLRSRFSKARTSDANLYQAQQLEANRIADQSINQANFQDWQEIKKTRAEALAGYEDNLARRTQIVNANIKSIAEYNQEIARIRAAKNKQDSTNISNYITGLGNTFNKLYQEKKKDLETKQNLLYNTQMSSEEELAKTYQQQALAEYEQWSKANPGKTIKDWPYYEQYKQFLQDITRNLARNKLYYATKWNGIEDNQLNYTKLQPFTDYLKFGGRLVPTYGYGGDLSQYFTPFQYQSYSTQQGTYEDKKKSQSVEQSTEKEDDDFQNDYIKQLLGYVKELKGLTSDSAYVSKYMMSILNKWKNNGEFLTPYDMAGDIMSLQQMIYRCTDEKTNFDKTYQNLYTKEALNDVAITGMGTIVVRNIKTKKLDNLSLENYIKYQDQYIPVSNAELARIRSNDPSLAFQTRINDILNSSVSAKTFDDYIEKAIKSLGTNYTMTSGPNKDILDGIEQLQNLTEEQQQQLVQELSNSYVNTKLVSKTQTPQIKMALEYLVSSMPKNYKVWAAFRLGTSKEDEAVKALAALKLSIGASSTSILDNMIKNGRSGTKGTGGRTSTGNSDDQKIGYWTAAQKELMGSLQTPIKIQYEGSKFDLFGTKLPNPEGVTGNMSLNQFLDRSKGSKELDTSKASANGIRLDPGALDMVMIQSNYQVSVLTLPAKPDGTPNMELLPKYQKFNSDLKKYKEELLANGYDANSDNYKNLVSQKINELTRNEPELAFALRGEGLTGSPNLKQYIVLRGVLPGNISVINSENQIAELDDVKTKDSGISEASKAEKDSYEFTLKKDDKGNDISQMEDYDGEYVTDIFIPFNDQNANTSIIADNEDLKLGNADENADLQLHFNYNPTQVNR